MKPYPSYKDSEVEWIGKIPTNWTIIKLNYTAQFVMGQAPHSDSYNEDGNGELFIKAGDFGKLYPVPKYYTSSPLVFGKEGDVFICIVGATSGKINLGIDGTISRSICALRPLGNILQKYIYYFLNYNYEHLNKMAEGSAQGIINKDILSSIVLPLSQISEQKQIVSYIDRKTHQIDDLIEKTEKKIELVKEKRTTLINHCVTKGLNPNVEMKDSGEEWIGEIPKGWNMISLKHLVSTKITDGPHETPEFADEGIPFLSVESVQNNKLYFNKKRGFITEEKHKEYSKKCKPQRDDVFLVKSGSTTGKSTIVETDEEFNIWSPLCIIRSDKSKVIPRFTFISLQAEYFRKFVELDWSFGTQPNIGMGVIENIRIIVPLLPEQKQIVEYIDEQTKKIDSTIEKENHRIDLLKEYRQSLISEVVTGKIDVRDEVVV